MPNSLAREVPFDFNVKDVTIDEIYVRNPTGRTLYLAVYDENRRAKLRLTVQSNNNLTFHPGSAGENPLGWILHDGSELRFSQEYENGREARLEGSIRQQLGEATKLLVTVIYSPFGVEKVEKPPDAPDDIPERIKALVDGTFDGLPVPKHPKTVGEAVTDFAIHGDMLRRIRSVSGITVVPDFDVELQGES